MSTYSGSPVRQRRCCLQSPVTKGTYGSRLGWISRAPRITTLLSKLSREKVLPVTSPSTTPESMTIPVIAHVSWAVAMAMCLSVRTAVRPKCQQRRRERLLLPRSSAVCCIDLGEICYIYYWVTNGNHENDRSRVIWGHDNGNYA